MADKVLDVDASQVTRNLQRIAAETPDAVDALIGRVLLEGVRRARDKTPVGDTGALRAANAARWHSGEQKPDRSTHANAEAPQPFALQPEGGEGYLYNSMSYAAAVHEDPDAHHNIGEYKFIEKALRELQPVVLKALRDDLLKEIGR